MSAIIIGGTGCGGAFGYQDSLKRVMVILHNRLDTKLRTWPLAGECQISTCCEHNCQSQNKGHDPFYLSVHTKSNLHIVVAVKMVHMYIVDLLRLHTVK